MSGKKGIETKQNERILVPLGRSRVHRNFHLVSEGSSFSAACANDAVPKALRSKGVVDLSFRMSRGRTHVDRSYQAGCLRMRQPRRDPVDVRPCAVLINTSGGLADGDSLTQTICWGENSEAIVTTQAAEKIYRALSQGSRINTRIEVASGAHAEWLPQETIMFDRARLTREAHILLEGDVSFLGLEAVILGRTAMGEQMRSGALSDRMRIYRDGHLIYADALELTGDIDALMRRSAIADGAAAMAILVHASAHVTGLLPAVRDALGCADGRAAASCWNGLLAVRFLAPDGATLRHDIMTVLAPLRGGRPLPRVWRC